MLAMKATTGKTSTTAQVAQPGAQACEPKTRKNKEKEKPKKPHPPPKKPGCLVIQFHVCYTVTSKGDSTPLFPCLSASFVQNPEKMRGKLLSQSELFTQSQKMKSMPFPPSGPPLGSLSPERRFLGSFHSPACPALSPWPARQQGHCRVL